MLKIAKQERKILNSSKMFDAKVGLRLLQHQIRTNFFLCHRYCKKATDIRVQVFNILDSSKEALG